jgi:hypothetical protein
MAHGLAWRVRSAWITASCVLTGLNVTLGDTSSVPTSCD